MAQLQMVKPVKLIVAALWLDPESLELALADLTQQWGRIDFRGPEHPFDATDYYESEMGAQLRRQIISFSTLVPIYRALPVALRIPIVDTLIYLKNRRELATRERIRCRVAT